MIVAAAFCPNPPVLIPELAQAAAVELDDLREACRTVIAGLAATRARLLVIGSGPSTRRHAPNTRGSLAGFGLDDEIALGVDEPRGPVELPLALTVAAWLLRDALGAGCGARGLSVDDAFVDGGSVDGTTAAPGADEPTALLVMGDGSARRSTSAPGYLDDRAGDFDATVEAALRSGRPSALTDLDPMLGAELLAAGVPAWHAAGAIAQGSYAGEVLYAAAPYGVGYFVASWTSPR